MISPELHKFNFVLKLSFGLNAITIDSLATNTLSASSTVNGYHIIKIQTIPFVEQLKPIGNKLEQTPPILPNHKICSLSRKILLMNTLPNPFLGAIDNCFSICLLLLNFKTDKPSLDNDTHNSEPFLKQISFFISDNDGLCFGSFSNDLLTNDGSY